MNKQKIDNFIGLCFTIHTEMDNSFLDSNYEYIHEKWNKFIGSRTANKDVYKNELINLWIEKWKIKEKEWDELKEVVDFLSSLEERPLVTELQTWRKINYNRWSLQELIDLFNNKTGLKISDIKACEYNHIHSNIKVVIEKWLEIPVNKRTYKLSQLDI
jgi:hypothetical protein